MRVELGCFCGVIMFFLVKGILDKEFKLKFSFFKFSVYDYDYDEFFLFYSFVKWLWKLFFIIKVFEKLIIKLDDVFESVL